MGWPVGSPEKGLELRRQKNTHRPAAAARVHHHHGVHVDLIQVGTLFSINLDADEIVIEQLRNRRALKTLVLHHVTPVTGGITDRQEDRFLGFARLLNSLVVPGIPIHRIVGVLQQIRTGLVGQAIWHNVSKSLLWGRCSGSDRTKSERFDRLAKGLLRPRKLAVTDFVSILRNRILDGFTKLSVDPDVFWNSTLRQAQQIMHDENLPITVDT